MPSDATTMRAAVLDAASGSISVRSVPIPGARAGEVPIRIEATALDASGARARDGRVIGAAGVGVIERGGGSLVVGSRVGFPPLIRCRRCAPCRTSRTIACAAAQRFGVDRDGAAAEIVSVPRASVYPLPPALDSVDAAAALLRYPQALRLIRDGGGLDAGDRVLVVGASSGLGIAATQLARAFGADVTAIASSDADGALAGTGADVRTSGPPGWSRGLSAMDLILLVAGNPRFASQALDSLTRGGTLVIAANADIDETLDLAVVADRQQRVVGSKGAADSDVRTVIDWLGQTEVRPVIAGRFSLDEAASAVELVHSSPPGEVVLTVQEATCGST